VHSSVRVTVIKILKYVPYKYVMRVWKNSNVSEHEVIWKVREHSSDPAGSVKSRYLLTTAAVTKFLRKILCYTV
jgi:hypothetical protein